MTSFSAWLYFSPIHPTSQPLIEELRFKVCDYEKQNCVGLQTFTTNFVLCGDKSHVNIHFLFSPLFLLFIMSGYFEDCVIHAKIVDGVQIDICISAYFKDRFHIYFFNLYFERYCIIYFSYVYDFYGEKSKQIFLSPLVHNLSVFRGNFECKLSPKYSLLLSLLVWSGTAF